MNPDSARTAAYDSASLVILAVDDEDVILFLMSELLGADGHTVKTATNGREALELFRAGECDVVLTDRNMPGMSGDELAREIKLIDPEIPVIMITGCPPAARDPSVDLLISKPVLRNRVAEAISKCLAQR